MRGTTAQITNKRVTLTMCIYNLYTKQMERIYFVYTSRSKFSSLVIQRTFSHKRFNRTCRLRNLVIKHKCVNFERDKWVAVSHHFRCCRYMDLRWGEAVALTEDDIYGGRVHITKSIHGQVKSKAGMRSVPHVSEFKVFPKTPKALRRELAEHGAHIHSLRHTYAYLLKTSGVHVTTAQKLMGHADPGVTLGIYTRFRDEEIDNAGAAIMDSLRGKSDYLMF